MPFVFLLMEDRGEVVVRRRGGAITLEAAGVMAVTLYTCHEVKVAFYISDVRAKVSGTLPGPGRGDLLQAAGVASAVVITFFIFVFWLCCWFCLRQVKVRRKVSFESTAFFVF